MSPFSGGGAGAAGGGNADLIKGAHLWTPVTASDFTLVNAVSGSSATSTLTDDLNGAVRIWATGDSTPQPRMARFKTPLPAATTPWTATAFLDVTSYLTDWWKVGLTLENRSGSGAGAGQLLQYYAFYDANQRHVRLQVIQATSITNSLVTITYTGQTYLTPHTNFPLWMRIRCDGANNLYFDISPKGDPWINWAGTTISNNIVPTDVGFYGDGSGQGINQHVYVHCHSFAIT